MDHLNEVKDDNRPENLVTTCRNCNRRRGAVLPFLDCLAGLDAFDAFVRHARQYYLRKNAVEVAAA